MATPTNGNNYVHILCSVHRQATSYYYTLSYSIAMHFNAVFCGKIKLSLIELRFFHTGLMHPQNQSQKLFHCLSQVDYFA